MKVFIVKDEFEMVRAMTLALEGSGHPAKSGVAGATAITQISYFELDILLTDLVMAELDGLKHCCELREVWKFRDLLTISPSSKSERYRHGQIHEAGAIGTIQKPFGVEAFAARVKGLASA